jgi:hypothetical protein
MQAALKISADSGPGGGIILAATNAYKSTI